jgi:hypothetical protein
VGSASGIGDVMVRFKGNFLKSATSSLSAGLDVSLPTGDEMNLLGTGATGLQPFVVWSGTFQNLSPHVNASYRWNGSSVLAGNPAEGESASFGDHIGYAVGADVSVHPRVTMAVDLLGRFFIDAERLRAEEFQALDGRSTFPNIVFGRDSFNALSGAIGLKANAFGRLLIDVNLLFKLDEHGLRDKVTPLIGVEYSF